jgi:hypothetical protein
MEFSVLSVTRNVLAASGTDTGGEVVAAMELYRQFAQLLVESTIRSYHPWLHKTPRWNT